MKPESHSDASRPTSPHWKFIQNENGAWRWYRGINGHGPGNSKEFDEFGPCLSDAIKNGFQPDTHHYATTSKGWHTDWSRQPDQQ
jgi:hypothetical protein